LTDGAIAPSIFEPAPLAGVHDGGITGGHIELGENRRDMVLDRLGRDEQPVRNLRIAETKG
jgi:hypothetical protein